jgi:hypothetical protein
MFSDPQYVITTSTLSQLFSLVDRKLTGENQLVRW